MNIEEGICLRYKEKKPFVMKAGRRGVMLKALGKSPDTYLDKLPLGQILIAPDGTIVSLNEAALSMMHFDSFDQCVGCKISKLFSLSPGEKSCSFMDMANRALRLHKPTQVYMNNPDCRLHHLHIIFTPIHAADGTFTGLLGLIQRIEPDMSEEELTAKNAFLHMPDLDVYIIDAKGCISFCNRTPESYVGLPLQQACSSEVFPNLPFYLEHIYASLNRSEEIHNKLVINPKNPNEAYRINVRRVYGENDSFLGVACVAINVSQELRLQRKLEISKRLALLGELASVTAHELRNPLAAIRASAQLGLRYKHIEKKNEALQKIISETSRLNKMITEFLFFSNPPTDPKQLCNLPDLFEEIMAMLNATIVLQRISVIYKFPPDLKGIYCQKPFLRQAFLNVIKNALESMPNGGTLEIEISQNETDTHITISDTGSGISPELLNNIFVPFVTTKQHGSGIGLSLAYHIIVVNHSGHIGINSTPEGGTSVHIRLPFLNES
jgi:signal transduction histidine kinase